MTEYFNLGYAAKKALEEAQIKLGHLNVLIAGRSGVGKSTLINAIFEGNFAKTGQGRPVTQEIKEYTKKGIPLSIFDTRGLEMAKYVQIIEDLKSFLAERAQSIDPNQHIHVAWVCIQEGSDRVEEAEINLVKMLKDRNIPVIAVITKIRFKKYQKPKNQYEF